MQHLRFLLAAVIALLGTVGGEAAPKKVAEAKREKAEAELRQLFTACFPRWDRNHDGLLTLEEINAQIENPQVRGDEAAAVVVVRRHFAPKGSESGFAGLTREQFLDFADDREAVRPFNQLRERIRSINRALFLPGDPGLHNFHQGRLGDCYLLSVIGAFVYRDPQAVRAMIKPLAGGGFEVRFGNGRVVKVPPVTDAELVLGAKMGADHGICLSVLEKAYAAIREEKREKQSDKEIEDDDAVTKDLLGGGRTGPVISMLTGHATEKAPVARWAKADSKSAAGRLHDLLVQLMREKRLMATGVSRQLDKPPRHIPRGHAYGVLGYNPSRRMVQVFNPWGNTVSPDGPPGLINGYVTRGGIFEVPLPEFLQIFGGLVYETGKPVKN